MTESKSKGTCLYGPEMCPKIEEVYKDISRMKEQIDSVYKLVYILVGIVVVEFGVSLI